MPAPVEPAPPPGPEPSAGAEPSPGVEPSSGPEPSAGAEPSKHPEPPAGYPAELTATVTLPDGSRLTVRPIRPDDEPRLLRLLPRLSAETVFRRFAVPVPRPRPALLRHLVVVDYVARLALVALAGDEVVGVARYDRRESSGPAAGPVEAEAAIVVEDAWQGRGVGRRLLLALADAARGRGIEVFTAEVMGGNRPVLGLLDVLGGDVEAVMVDGVFVVRVRLPSAAAPGA